jgi:CxxC-x17-CxxC domain-containing protein
LWLGKEKESGWFIISVLPFPTVYLRHDFTKFQKDMPFEREREMFKATCGDCGTECQVPFKPREDKPVYCRECFQNHKPADRGNTSRFGGRSNYGRNDRNDRGSRFSRDDRPREMHTATCGDCGNECQIPFKPKEDRPVYCRECFQNHKN